MIHMENLVMDMKATKKRKKSNRRSSNGSGGNKANEPMKVVYISNPMKFEIRASEFRRLVQELTGQDAEFPPSLRHNYNNPPAASDSSSDSSPATTTTATPEATVDSSVAAEEEEDQDAPPLQAAFEEEDPAVALVDGEQVDEWDGAGEFVPEMLENLTVFHYWHLDFDFSELIDS